MSTTYRIAEHYDPSGIITADSDPAAEYARWQEHAAENPADWTGEEFTLADFVAYIAGLGLARKIYTIDVIDDLGREWEPMASSHATAAEAHAHMDAILPGLRRDFARDTGRAQTLTVTLYECDREEDGSAGSGHGIRSEQLPK